MRKWVPIWPRSREERGQTRNQNDSKQKSLVHSSAQCVTDSRNNEWLAKLPRRLSRRWDTGTSELSLWWNATTLLVLHPPLQRIIPITWSLLKTATLPRVEMCNSYSTFFARTELNTGRGPQAHPSAPRIIMGSSCTSISLLWYSVEETLEAHTLSSVTLTSSSQRKHEHAYHNL